MSHSVDDRSVQRSFPLSICVILVAAYAALAWLLIGAGDETLSLTLWTTSPLGVLLLAIAGVRRQRIRTMITFLLACLWIAGAVLLVWGLVLNPGDYNQLVVLFLPIYMFAFIAVTAVAYGTFALVRAAMRHSRS